MTTLLYGTLPAHLHGGPYAGEHGEVTQPTPKHLAVGPEGGFVYEFHHTDDRGAHFRYAPALSAFHPGIVEADRQAILEVAQSEGVGVDVVIGRLTAARTLNPDRVHPADAFMAEAERLGVNPLDLLAQHEGTSELIIGGQA